MVSHLGELEQFAILVRQAEPKWLLLALLLQMATYVSVSAIWYVPLRCNASVGNGESAQLS